MSQNDQSGVSPVGYIAESSKEPRLNPSGENNEQNTLYRIGCTQEKRELLHQTGRRHSGSGGESGGSARGLTAMGETVAAALGRSNGSDAVQRLDLRRAEAIRGEIGNGTSADAGGDHGGQEEERRDRCGQAQR